jgi:hypothetical protein
MSTSPGIWEISFTYFRNPGNCLVSKIFSGVMRYEDEGNL